VIPCCVIGGAGFIGSHLVELLVTRGRQVTVIDQETTPAQTLSEGVCYVSGDYGDRDFLRVVLEGKKEIIDLAYATVPKTSFESPVNDIISNLPASVNLFEVASSLEIHKLIVVSSGGVVYGLSNNLPIPETHPTNPISPYGITKLAVEKYAFMFHRISSLPVILVRPSNAYGERQKPFTGQGFVATAIASILKGREIMIYGNQGTIRDYIHAKDLVRGIVATLEHGTPGSCYNIGTGRGKSNLEVLDAILPFARELGLEPRIKIIPAKAYDVPANVLDSTKLFNETGWKPTISFENGMERAWNWYRDALCNFPVK
jgi:UDP-glucose 4-epimerase